jgi:hypothetical protein
MTLFYCSIDQQREKGVYSNVRSMLLKFIACLFVSINNQKIRGGGCYIPEVLTPFFPLFHLQMEVTLIFIPT